jgi:hypothetical protein
MANTINIPKAHLIMALCLPLAVLLGYFVADPMESGSLAVVVIVLFVLSVPLMMKWHHPLLVLSWNAGITVPILPGHPLLWMLMAAAGLIFALLNRSVSSQNQFVYVPSLTLSLLLLLAVVIVTASATGGIGLRSMGATKTYGGQKYAYVFAAAMGYFALTSRRIPVNRAGLYLALFFLPGLLALAGNLIYAAGPGSYFLLDYLPSDTTLEMIRRDYALGTFITRYAGFGMAAVAISSYLLARYGVRGIFDLGYPWRLLLFLLAMFGFVFCSYRSILILFILVFACAFWLEGLWRTRWLPLLAGAVLLVGVLVLPQMQKLPLEVQRTLSFLPGKIDPAVRADADGSLAWRVEMWNVLLPEVPKYLIKGKGFATDATDLYMAGVGRNSGDDNGASLIAGNYHNGPLSIIIPFGIFGVIGFTWFLAAGVRYLYHHYRFGDPALKQANTFLLAALIAKIVFFLTVFGGFFGDLYAVAGLIGLGVSLNGETSSPVFISESEHAMDEPVEADLVT